MWSILVNNVLLELVSKSAVGRQVDPASIVSAVGFSELDLS